MDPATGIYSCDDHLDLSAVPPELWQSRLPRALAARAPQVVTREGRAVWVWKTVLSVAAGTPA